MVLMIKSFKNLNNIILSLKIKLKTKNYSKRLKKKKILMQKKKLILKIKQNKVHLKK